MNELVHNTTRLSLSAVCFAILIIIGIALTFISLAGALALSFGNDVKLPHSLIPFFVLVLGLVITAAVFFVASYLASRVAHQKILFDALMHGLATWSCLGIMLVGLLGAATAAEGLRRNLSHISLTGSSLVTDINILKAQAVTSLSIHQHPSEHKPAPSEQRADWFLIWAWWGCFLALVSGLGVSLGGAYLGHKGRLTEPS